MLADKGIERLNNISKEVLLNEDDSTFLIGCLGNDAPFPLKAKAFLTLKYVIAPELYPALDRIIVGEERHWQLMALYVIGYWQEESMLPTVSKLLCQREQPLLIRGALAALAEINPPDGGEIFRKFIKSPFSGYLKDDFLALIERIILGNGNEEDYAHLSVYPFPDYLCKVAMANGMTAGEWKQLTWFPRKKVKSVK